MPSLHIVCPFPAFQSFAAAAGSVPMILNLPLLLCLFLWTSGVATAADPLHVLELGSSLTPASQPLYSSSSSFVLSFRPFTANSTSIPNSTSLFLAISYSLLNSSAGYPAWVANRNTPVSASASLTLSSSGDLLLSDPIVSSVSIWSTNTSGLGVVQAQLLESGNLVLLNRSSGYVWQSFHFPTDTLLPGQDFTASSASLIANQKSDDFMSGRFSLNFTPDGVLQLVNTQNSIAHWDAGQIAFLRFDMLGNITLYNSSTSNKTTYIPNDHGKSAMRRITLDMDGNLRMYTWDVTANQWICVWMVMRNICDRVQGLCGSYGVCTYKSAQPTCVCPQGFSVVDSTDLSSGCVANYALGSNCSTSTKYVELVHVDFPYNDYLNFSYSSVDECKRYCSSSCKCVAAVYWQSQGHCWLKQSMENGAVRWSQMYHVFVKISDADPLISSPVPDKATTWSSLHLGQQTSSNQSSIVHVTRRKHFDTVVALGVFLAVQTVCITAGISVLITRYNKHWRYARVDEDLEGSLHVFSYEELRAASQNFSLKVGEGGFGTVYKGQLENGKLVAIKQLVGISQQEKQFRAEIVTLGRIHHINLLPLLGFCAEGNHRLLVYEYMGKGSLDRELFEGDDTSTGHLTFLDWSTRFRICVDVARGLHYLHAECLDPILHCDIKPENVLLDTNYCAKVADFGVAYLYSRNHTLKVSTIRGTRGYMAPEWVSGSHLPITAGADVYSYGMLIMEVLSGRRNYLYTESSMMDANEKWCFPIWAHGRRIEEVVDTRLDRSSIDWEQAELVLKVAFTCIQADIDARPLMGKVVQMLEGIVPVPDAPPFSLFIPNNAPPLLSVSSSTDASAIYPSSISLSTPVSSSK